MSELFLVLFLVGIAGAGLAVAGSVCNLVTALMGLSHWELFAASIGLSIGAIFIGTVVGAAKEAFLSKRTDR